MRDQFNRRLDSLGDTAPPLFGQLSLWILIAVCIYIVGDAHLTYQSYPKGTTVSLLGYIVPEQFFDQPYALAFFKNVFFVSATAWSVLPFLGRTRIWIVQPLIAIAPWVCVLSYTILVSIFWENLPWFRHKFIVPNWVLLYYALWYLFYRDDIAASIVNKKFWLNPNLYPRWVYLGSVLSIALLYNYGGVSKFLAAGFNWGEGLSLQLWVSMMGKPDFILTEFILSDRENAHLLQRGVTIVQSFALLALIPHLRPVIGLGLIAFQLSVELTFGIPFRGNIVLLAVFFLPWFGVFEGLVASLKKVMNIKHTGNND
ncbi:MAG: hypothetical protein HOI74_10950 [Gammaproteobacteria bacterium]|nr:hypothetical protein [Gammaproteobacteria bacterium]